MYLSEVTAVPLTFLWVILAIIVLFPCVVFLGECLGAILPFDCPITGYRPQKIAVLIPAHNEAEIIGQTLSTIIPQLESTDILMVVADNCTDATASIALAQGAIVVERFDTRHKGKGYALAHGVRTLDCFNPNVVVLLDADCELQKNALLYLATQASTLHRPVQGKYLMSYPPEPSMRDLISGFAFLVKNWVRPLGLAHFSFPCLLTGTGMAFPWSILQNAPLATDNIVEDMQLGLDLAIAGYPPQFCPKAEILGKLPQGSDIATKQRTRWEHGHLKTLWQQCPRLLQSAWQQRRLDLFILAAELSIPPLSLLILLWLGLTFFLSIATIWQFVGILPLVLLLVAGISLSIGILVAWTGFAPSQLKLSSLLMIPLYLLWKIPLYFAFLLRPQTEWVRTAREKK